jgi:protein SCO1
MKRLFFIFCLLVVCVTFRYLILQKTQVKKLPVLNPIDLKKEMVDPELLRIGQGHKIGNFKFENQFKEMISEEEIEGKVFVAEYFFTTCQSICPLMNKQMMRVQEKFRGNHKLKILSFTVDPDIDSAEQLLFYSKNLNAKKGQWHFLTGKKQDLYNLARKSFFLLKPAEAQNLGDAGSDFIHTNNFVLVDQKKRIRGYYDGTNEEEVSNLILDISILLKD